MVDEDSFDGVGCDDVTEVLECALNAVVSPARIVHRHLYNEFFDFARDARPASSVALVGPFLRDQLPMPAEDSVRSEKRRVLVEELATETLALRREPTSLRIGE